MSDNEKQMQDAADRINTLPDTNKVQDAFQAIEAARTSIHENCYTSQLSIQETDNGNHLPN